MEPGSIVLLKYRRSRCLSLRIALVEGSMIDSDLQPVTNHGSHCAEPGRFCVGTLSLSLIHLTLSNRQPTIDNGLFTYAGALGGEYLSFNST